jgi:hypothetical protein
MPLAVRADERGWEQTAQTPGASPQAHTPRHARRQARTLRQLVASGCYTSEGLRSSQPALRQMTQALSLSCVLKPFKPAAIAAMQ